MENDDIISSSGSSFLVLALAILGTVLGGMALYTVFNLKQSLQDNNSAAIQAEQWNELETSLALLDERLTGIDLAGKKTAAEFQQLSEEIKQAFDQVAERLKANREAINLTRKELTTPPSPEIALPSPPADAAPTVELPEDTRLEEIEPFHIIVPGDTFQKIADQYKVSLQALIDTNPGLEPRFLHVGQRVMIPE